MRKKLFQTVLISFTLCFCVYADAQVEGLDSLDQKIMESVHKSIKQNGGADFFMDTADLFNGKSPVDIGAIFKQVHNGLVLAKSLGDYNRLKGNYKGALENYKLYTLYRDSLQKNETAKKELEAKLKYEYDKKQAVAKAEQEKKDAEQKRIKNLQYFTIAGLTLVVLVILLFALIQWRNNRQKKKANTLLQQQNEKVESALSELKSTQASLIHSEKMASLGELTAGIAHEIQNPLNFVNNFGEVNSELIHEIVNENNIDEIKVIANDIRLNNEKIVFHGKRADEIVKGMLQHSRSGTGVKEPTDINALCDEFLRISYYGFLAKEKDFSATLETDFDPGIDKVNVVPQDIGRVLLNLYNNAFYATNEKLKSQKEKFQPVVTLTTRRLNSPQSGGTGSIEISVKDNGNGIPKNIVDKIFQPFFTTKPTGQGTGLGLSLSYDIVKANGGEIKVTSRESEGTVFTITL